MDEYDHNMRKSAPQYQHARKRYQLLHTIRYSMMQTYKYQEQFHVA